MRSWAVVLESGTVVAVVSRLNSAILPLLIAADCKVTALASNLSRMTSVWELANPQLRDLAVYEPGKPIEETARELGVDPSEIIKLASNENSLGPSPKAVAAIRAALETAHLYPDGSGFC